MSEKYIYVVNGNPKVMNNIITLGYKPVSIMGFATEAMIQLIFSESSEVWILDSGKGAEKVIELARKLHKPVYQKCSRMLEAKAFEKQLQEKYISAA